MSIISIQKLRPSDLNNKKVLARVDFDVPISPNNKVGDLTRIEACIPTIKYLLERGAKTALLTKLGRPEKEGNPKISTKILVPYLENLLHTRTVWLNKCIGAQVEDLLDNLTINELLLLENIRFYKEEFTLNQDFAEKLVKPFDIYVNEAFAMCHRNETSIALAPKLLRSYGGFRLIEEIENLKKVIKSPKRPLVAILGGAKIETKLPVIDNLAKIADKILVGGKLPFSKGFEKFKTYPNVVTIIDDIDKKDIGPKSIKLFMKEISKAKTIIWNGPMGMFEIRPYYEGTNKIAKAIVKTNAYKIVGGGDTISALKKIKLLEKFDFVSTGGGAMLAFLSGNTLPGIEALKISGNLFF